MSAERIDLARRGYAALAAGDLDSVLELVDPEIELEIYTGRPDLPETQRLHGHSGFIENLTLLSDVFDDIEVEPEEFIEVGEDLVVVIHTTGRGKGSGIKVDNRVVHIWTIREGMATRFRVYASKEEALAAAGAAEQNVATVRTVVQALQGGDYDLAATHLHSGAEWHNTASFPGPRTCCGLDEIKAFWRSFFDAFDRAGMELEQVAPAGETVVVQIHSWGTGKGSGAPIDVRWACVYRLRSGKVNRVDVYGDYRKALEAAGLME